jgi:hypothetical protein
VVLFHPEHSRINQDWDISPDRLPSQRRQNSDLWLWFCFILSINHGYAKEQNNQQDNKNT